MNIFEPRFQVINYTAIIAISHRGDIILIEEADGSKYKHQDLASYLNDGDEITMGNVDKYEELKEAGQGVYKAEVKVVWSKDEDTANGPGEWESYIESIIIKENLLNLLSIN